MDFTWIIVANHITARILERPNFRSDLRTVQVLDSPTGRLKAREINSDRPGRYAGTTASPGPGMKVGISGKHGYSPENNPQHEKERHFAQEIATFLREAGARGEFQGLILVADPHFLGSLRAALDKPLLSKVVGTVGKNLLNLPEKEIMRHLEAELAVVDAQTPFLRTGS